MWNIEVKNDKGSDRVRDIRKVIGGSEAKFDKSSGDLELEKLKKELDQETKGGGRELWSLERSSQDVREVVGDFEEGFMEAKS